MRYIIRNGQPNTFVYKFGTIIDPEGKDVDLSIASTLEDFMTFDKVKKQLTFEPTKAGVYFV